MKFKIFTRSIFALALGLVQLGTIQCEAEPDSSVENFICAQQVNGTGFYPADSWRIPVGQMGASYSSRALCEHAIASADSGLICTPSLEAEKSFIYSLKKKAQAGYYAFSNVQDCQNSIQGTSGDLICIPNNSQKFSIYDQSLEQSLADRQDYETLSDCLRAVASSKSLDLKTMDSTELTQRSAPHGEVRLKPLHQEVILGGRCEKSRDELSDLESAHSTDLQFLDTDPMASQWACLELSEHLQDDSLKNCTPDSKAVFQGQIKNGLLIRGLTRFHFAGLPIFGFRGFSTQKKYSYSLNQDLTGTIHLKVKIRFVGAMLREPGFVDLLQKGLDKAAQVWTEQSPVPQLKFEFLSVGAEDEPDFTIKIKRGESADLYDTYWSETIFRDDYRALTIAHELGHMMGLPDEYDPVRSVVWKVDSAADTLRCDIRHLMCDTYNGKQVPDYYYYLILRRAFCIGNE